MEQLTGVPTIVPVHILPNVNDAARFAPPCLSPYLNLVSATAAIARAKLRLRNIFNISPIATPERMCYNNSIRHFFLVLVDCHTSILNLSLRGGVLCPQSNLCPPTTPSCVMSPGCNNRMTLPCQALACKSIQNNPGAGHKHSLYQNSACLPPGKMPESNQKSPEMYCTTTSRGRPAYACIKSLSSASPRHYAGCRRRSHNLTTSRSQSTVLPTRMHAAQSVGESGTVPNASCKKGR